MGFLPSCGQENARNRARAGGKQVYGQESARNRARLAFQQMLQEDPGSNAIYVSDIIKEGWKENDPRL